MAKSVQARLTKLSNEYSANVKKVRELEAAKKKPFVTDAEVKKINEEINKLNAERTTIVDKSNSISKIAKSADEYVDLNKKLAEYETQIAKRIARGESTADLDKAKQDTLGKLSKIAPTVEKNFPELKKAEPKSTKTGPAGNLQLSTGTVLDTTASKAAAAKDKVKSNVVVENIPSPATQTALAKKEAARTKKLGAVSKEGVVTSDYAQRNAGMAAAKNVVHNAQKIVLAGNANWPIKSGGTLVLRVGTDNKLYEISRTITAPTAPSESLLFDDTTINSALSASFKYNGAAAATLVEIENGFEGKTIKIYGKTGAALTVEDVATVSVGADVVLDADTKFIELVKVGNVWYKADTNA